MTGGFGTQKFYRLIAYPPGMPVPPLLVITSVQAFPGGGIQLQWLGSTNYLYDILWSSNLALPAANWNVLSNLTFRRWLIPTVCSRSAIPPARSPAARLR